MSTILCATVQVYRRQDHLKYFCFPEHQGDHKEKYTVIRYFFEFKYFINFFKNISMSFESLPPLSYELRAVSFELSVPCCVLPSSCSLLLSAALCCLLAALEAPQASYCSVLENRLHPSREERFSHLLPSKEFSAYLRGEFAILRRLKIIIVGLTVSLSLIIFLSNDGAS